MRLETLLVGMTTAVLVAGAAQAGEEVTQIRWSKLQESGQLEFGEVVTNEGTEELLIRNESAQPLTVRLATLERAGMKSHLYTVRGEIRYEDVAEPGYLEMWNHFSNGGAFFSRTVSESGPMGVISGTSTKREVIIPFQSDAETGPPEKIELSLVLPSSGRVWIGPLTLTEFSEAEWGSAMRATGAWWSPSQGGLVGGILGPFVGLLGAAIGTLAGLGLARGLCLALCWFSVAFGVICTVAGIIAVSTQQPYEVYYPLLLCGIIAVAVMGGLMGTVRKRYEDAELRRMKSMDAGVPV